MQKYKKYHTDIKTSYALGIQDQVLPPSFINQIPNTTSHYWKQENPEKYVGTEFSDSVRNSLDDTKVFLDERLKLSREAFVQFGRLYLTIIQFIGKENLRKLIKQNRNDFVSVFENLSEDFFIPKQRILQFLSISTKQYATWLGEQKSFCSKSVIGQCYKKDHSKYPKKK